MYNSLVYERTILQNECIKLLVKIRRETNKEKASELLSELLKFEKRIESINCKLVHMKFMEMFKKAEES